MVLGVDGHRQHLGTVIGSLFRLRHQRPHLAAGNSEAALGSDLAPDLPLPQRVAVALVIVAGDAGRKKVGLEVARQLEWPGITLEETAETALASGEVELAGVRLRGSGIRGGIERRV